MTGAEPLSPDFPDQLAHPSGQGAATNIAARIETRLTEIAWATVTVVSAVFVFVALVGAVQYFHPLPYWDQWGGQVDFWLSRPTDVGDWFALHNEHRIPLTRLIFAVDFLLFKGSGPVLVILNFVLSLFLFLGIYFLYVRERGHASRSERVGTLAATLAVSTLWIQRENLLWGFQSQFFLAYLLPVIAFSAAARFVYGKEWRAGATALTFAVMSAGAMANGVVALPVVVAYWARRLGRRSAWLWASVATTVVTGLLYSRGYQTPSHHGDPFATLRSSRALVEYVINYLGGPVYWFTGSQWAAFVAGIFLLAMVSRYTGSALLAAQSSRSRDALTLIALFVVLSATVTGLGRAVFGFEQAYAGRYQTPALLAWVAVALLSALSLNRRRLRTAGVPFAVLLALGLGWDAQSHALDEQAARTFVQGRELATLALSMEAVDAAVLNSIVPDPLMVAQIGSAARQAGLTVVGSSPNRDLQERLGQVAATMSTVCAGWIDAAERIPALHGSDLIRISGWSGLLEEAATQTDGRLTFTDSSGVIFGYGVTGYLRTDVADVLGRNDWMFSGFAGYVDADANLAGLHPVGKDSRCINPLSVDQSVGRHALGGSLR